jgi:hypothetical protein
MVTSVSDCQGFFEQGVVVLLAVSILASIVSGFSLFNGEQIGDRKGTIFAELLGPLHPLVTGKYLTDRAAKWRWPFFGSISMIVICSVVLEFGGICVHST